MNLCDIIPIAKVEVALGRPADVERLNTADVGEALRHHAQDVFGVAAWVWHRIVTSAGSHIDPRPMRRYLDHRDPELARAIESLIHAPLFKEFGVLRATVRHAGKPFVVATSCAAHLYDDELHLYDVGLADPDRPLSRHERKSGTQHHRGPGLLAQVMRNVFDAARERGCPIVTLAAANTLLVDVFARYGFEVERSAFADEALACGIAIPMEAATGSRHEEP